jgi:citrate synthase
MWGVSPNRAYDPGYLNTASATSRISYIDGDKGILRYAETWPIAFLMHGRTCPVEHSLTL